MWKKLIPDSDTLIDMGIRAGVVLLILVVTVITAKLVRKALSKKEQLMGVDTTRYKFLTHFFTGFIYFIGILLALHSIPSLRGLSASIFAGSGVLAIIIGFASQQAFANIVGGIFIAVFKPFRLGDRLKLVGKDVIGTVEDINLRHTVIRTFDQKRIVVPNSVISSEILENANIVDQKILKFFEVGISYDSDIDKAMAVIKEEALKHPLYFDNRTEEEIADNVEPVRVKVIGFGDSSVNLRAYIWTKDPIDAYNLGCDLNKSVKERFDSEGIEIPFPHRTVVYKKDVDNKDISANQTG